MSILPVHFSINTNQTKIIRQLYIVLQQKGLKEANWRISLLIYKEIGFHYNLIQMKANSKKAFKKNIIDGIFCFAFSLRWEYDLKSSFQIFQNLSELNYPAGKYMFGIFLYYGLGIERNKIEGLNQRCLSGKCGDAAIAKRVSKNFQFGECGFPKDQIKATEYNQIALQFEITEVSLFQPFD